MFGLGNVMVRRFTLLFLILFAAGGFTVAQAPAHDRARRLGLGMNLSYLDNWWSGTKDKAYSDFVKPAEAAKREKMFADIAKAVTEQIPAEIVTTPSNYPRSYRINSDKLLKAGFKPKKTVADAIREIVVKFHLGELMDSDRHNNLRWMQR
jgi:hypothetical protein